MAWLLGIGIPILGAAFLLVLSNRTTSFIRYQLISLFAALAMSGLVLALSPIDSIYKIGNLSAPSHNFIGASYAAFTCIALVITTLVVYWQVVYRKGINQSLFLRFLVFALPLSAMNALTEELIFRASIIQLTIHVAEPAIVVLIAGLLFGIPHYFGHPGKIPGALMATFLGVIAAQSVFDTGGLGWAWIMHFTQDIPIITMLLMTGTKKL